MAIARIFICTLFGLYIILSENGQLQIIEEIDGKHYALKMHSKLRVSCQNGQSFEIEPYSDPAYAHANEDRIVHEFKVDYGCENDNLYFFGIKYTVDNEFVVLKGFFLELTIVNQFIPDFEDTSLLLTYPINDIRFPKTSVYTCRRSQTIEFSSPGGKCNFHLDVTDIMFSMSPSGFDATPRLCADNEFPNNDHRDEIVVESEETDDDDEQVDDDDDDQIAVAPQDSGNTDDEGIAGHNAQTSDNAISSAGQNWRLITGIVAAVVGVIVLTVITAFGYKYFRKNKK